MKTEPITPGERKCQIIARIDELDSELDKLFTGVTDRRRVAEIRRLKIDLYED